MSIDTDLHDMEGHLSYEIAVRTKKDDASWKLLVLALNHVAEARSLVRSATGKAGVMRGEAATTLKIEEMDTVLIQGVPYTGAEVAAAFMRDVTRLHAAETARKNAEFAIDEPSTTLKLDENFRPDMMRNAAETLRKNAKFATEEPSTPAKERHPEAKIYDSIADSKETRL